MKKKNLKIMQRVGEERYFSDWSEMFDWYCRQAGMTGEIDEVFSGIDRLCESIKKPDRVKEYLPDVSAVNSVFRVYGDNHRLQYNLQKGNFVRKSGSYQICVVASDKFK